MFKKKIKREPILMTLRKTRKAFLIEYGCGAIVLMLVFLVLKKDISVPNPLIYLGLFAGIAAPVYAELSRLITRYKITPTKLVIITGIIKQNKKNVYFHPLGFVPDLNIKQGRVQRILNYGTVFLKGGVENMFEIKDVNRPQKVLNTIEDLVEDNRGTMGATKPKEK